MINPKKLSYKISESIRYLYKDEEEEEMLVLAKQRKT